MTVFTGTFGSGIFTELGADPTKLIGPISTIGTAGGGIPGPQFRVGTKIFGSEGSEFIFAKLTLASVTDVLPGQMYAMDVDYNLTLATNAAATLNYEAAFGLAFSNATPIGAYYQWVAVAGHIPVKCTGTANGFGETTATAGLINFAASATASQKSVSPSSLYAASLTFTANTVNGSPNLTNVSSANSLVPGALIAGTGIPASTAIGTITKTGNTFTVGMVQVGTGTYATPQNATANGTAITVTVTGTLPANVQQPTFNKQN